MNPSCTEQVTPSRIRVLLAVKSGFLRDSINAFLQSFHYVKIVEAELNVEFCLAEISQLHPQVLILDCSSANPGWVGLLHEIHRCHADIACVAITHTNFATRQAIDLGAVAVLPNGFTSRELGLAICRAAQPQQNNPTRVTEAKA
jgi:DNA-binding NarL/FixJ family response regulator